MAIEKIAASGGGNIYPIDPVQQKQGVNKTDQVRMAERATGDVVEISQEARLAQEIARVQQMLAEVPEPNAARLAELKEKIQGGTYLSQSVVDETATILASRLL